MRTQTDSTQSAETVTERLAADLCRIREIIEDGRTLLPSDDPSWRLIALAVACIALRQENVGGEQAGNRRNPTAEDLQTASRGSPP